MPTADLIVVNARVFTAEPGSTAPSAEALAVRGRRLACVGTAAEAAAWRGAHTRVVDGRGGTLLPGYIDSHFHLLGGSLELGDLQLAGIADLSGLGAALRDYAGAHPASPWLVGQGLSYHLAGPGPALTRHELDAWLPNRPAILYAYDHHTAWANTLALEAAGLLRSDRPPVPNSEIVRGADGLASGELREPGAYAAIQDLIPPPDAAQKHAALRRGLAQAASLGITSVHNMDGGGDQMALYAALEELGELTLRVYVPFEVRPETRASDLREAAALRQAYQSHRVRAGSVKFFMDGVIESYTALTLAPYAGRPGCFGGANFGLAHFTTLAQAADELGLQIAVHAIGDAAVRRALDGLAAAQGANGRRDSRHRLEHIELVDPADLPRFVRLGVLASMQPLHAPLSASTGDVWLARAGRERWALSFAWQALRDAGAHLVFGSDWPVVSQNPLLGLHAALTRQPYLPGLPDQRQSLVNALASYTRCAAYAEFQEHIKGQLRPGYLADFVLLSADVFSLPPEALLEVRPVLTVCDGEIVFEA